MPKAALHNLGCKVNYYETEAMKNILLSAGYTIVGFEEASDLYIINTCSVTAIADKKSRQMIHRAKSMNPDAIIIAAGCFVQTSGITDPKELGADILIGNNEKHNLLTLIDEYKNKNNAPVTDVIDINDGSQEYETLHLVADSDRTRAFIKVQDGCNRFCSYCIIPYARGRARSRKISDVLEELTKIADCGFKEIVLTGIHVSSFGTDTGESFIDLIEQAALIPGIERIRLGSLEPVVVTEEFALRASKIDKLCAHFHLSLQSGCDKTLSDMNRRYTSDEFYKGVEILRKYFNNPALTTDVIVGFPGESEEDFKQSYDFVKKCGFFELHVFPYSKRQGTRAAKMKNQLTEAVKKTRSKQLIELGQKQSLEYIKSYIGKEVEVLLEEPYEYQGKCYYTGFTKEYIRVVMDADLKDYSNIIVKGRITSLLTDEIGILTEG